MGLTSQHTESVVPCKRHAPSGRNPVLLIREAGQSAFQRHAPITSPHPTLQRHPPLPLAPARPICIMPSMIQFQSQFQSATDEHSPETSPKPSPEPAVWAALEANPPTLRHEALLPT